MKFSLSPNWMLVLVLIFTGQTLAVPIPNLNDCEMEHAPSSISENKMTNKDMDSMLDHDMSKMGTNFDDKDSQMTMECCDDCQCSEGLYLSTIYFSKLNNNLVTFNQSRVVFAASQFTNTQRSSSIYRPPILS